MRPRCAGAGRRKGARFRANAEARIAPTREGYVNAIQVWPFTDGALYQVMRRRGA